MDERRMPFTEHLDELRRRLIVSVLTLLVVFVAVFLTAADPIFEYLLIPLKAALVDIGAGAETIHFTSPIEPLFTLMKCSGAAAFLICIPMLLYQFWGFVAPGLYKNERGALAGFVIVGSLLFFLGAAFGYFYVLPLGLKYLMVTFTQPYAKAIITYKEFFSFAFKFLLAFGIAFELPLVMYLLGRLGIVHGDSIRKTRGYAVVGIVVAAAVLTPPDPLTQVMLAVPLMVLYEISIWLVVLTSRKRDKEWHAQMGETPEPDEPASEETKEEESDA